MPRALHQTSQIRIVGGGIVGLSTALVLADDGHAVTLIDNDPEGTAASWGNAGHIAVEQVEPLASPASLRAAPGMLLRRDGALALPPGAIRQWLPFALRMTRAATPDRFAAGRASLTALLADSMDAWRRLTARLGSPDLLRDEGHFILWETPRSARAGEARWQALAAPTARFRPATTDELARLSTLTARPPAGALRCLGSGRIVGHERLRIGLHRALDRAGVRRMAGTARLERAEDGRCRVLVDGQPPETPDLVILTAGVASRPLIEALGHKAPMIAERGYHLHAAGRAWPADLPPVVFEDRSMIVTRFESGVRASSFVEMAAPDRPADPRRWDALRRKIDALGLPFERDAERWMGARPTLPDYLPAIGRSRHCRNLIYAFGHQHLGLTLAPTTAGIVAALAAHETPPISLAPYDLARFEGKLPS